MHDALLSRPFTVNSPRLHRQRETRAQDDEEPTQLSARDAELIARRVRDQVQRPRLLSDPVHYAVRLGFAVVDHLDGDDALVEGATLHYRWDADPRVRGARVAWALSAAILLGQGWVFTAADVWRVAAALLYPAALARRTPTLSVARRLQPHAPDWLLAGQLAQRE